MKKIGVLLSGCGVYDGAEIQEAVFTLLAIEELGEEAICIGIDKEQYHVINHLNGSEMQEKRNMFVEAARISRGAITEIKEIVPSDLDALVIPGGFGSAKNLTTWAFLGADATIIKEVKELIVELIELGKPICALCVSPVVVAKALQDSGISALMTIGSTEASSPYDIASFRSDLEATGARTVNKLVSELAIDEKYKIISAPCYMMETGLVALRNNIKTALEETLRLSDCS